MRTTALALAFSFAALNGIVAQAPTSTETPAPKKEAPSDLEQLQAVWRVGSQWVCRGGVATPTKVFTVDSFEDDRLVLSRPSTHKSGRDVFRLAVLPGRKVEILDAAHTGTAAPIASRNHRGKGAFNPTNGLTFEMTAEVEPLNKKWKPWRVAVTLRQFEELDVLQVGTELTGSRTDPNSSTVARIKGHIKEWDGKLLVIECNESWRAENGHMATPVWRWRFQLDAQKDKKTGAPRWTVLDGECVKGGNTRSNWRGYVLLQQGRLVGEYGFDWPGMSRKGARPGTEDLQHPLTLDLAPNSVPVKAN